MTTGTKNKMCNHFCYLIPKNKETTRPEWFLVVRTVEVNPFLPYLIRIKTKPDKSIFIF